MRYQGKLVEWHDDQGYGFIQPVSDGQNDQKIFVHIKAFKARGPRPLTGVVLEYDVALDSQGRLNAQQVAYVSRKTTKAKSPDKKTAQSTQFKSQYHVWLIIGYFAFVLALSMTAQWPWWGLLVIAALSVVTYGVYAMDKRAAQRNDQRVPESNLHLLAVLGGWPGALFAQQNLRHKSIKQPFRRIFWFTVAMNWVLIGLLTVFILPNFLPNFS